MKAGPALLAVTLAFTLARSARADDASIDVLVSEASALEQSGDLAGATKKLEEAFAQSQRADVAGKLGLLEQRNGDYSESAQHLELAMRFFPEGRPPAERQKLIEAFTDVRAKVAAVRFRVKPDAEHVTIDGRIPSLTSLDYDVFVMPGTRRISVPGRADVTIEAVANQSYPIDVASVPKVMAAPKPKTEASKRPVWPIAIGSILAAGGLGLGIGMTVVAGKRSSDAKSIAQSSTCAGVVPSAECLASGYRATNEHNTFQAVGIAGFVGGGVALLSTIAYAAWPGPSVAPTSSPKSGSASAPMALVPVVGPGIGALRLEGSF